MYSFYSNKKSYTHYRTVMLWYTGCPCEVLASGQQLVLQNGRVRGQVTNCKFFWGPNHNSGSYQHLVHNCDHF